MSRYDVGNIEAAPDGPVFVVVEVDTDGTRAWASTDGHLYPIGSGPELPEEERRGHGMSIVWLLERELPE